jgi:AcrR family transcriptional regulator
VSPLRPTLSRDEYITAALAFIDEHGFTALTLRSLGTAVGASHTAVYRHFPDVAALLTAVADSLVAEAMAEPPPPGSPPRERILQRFRVIKRVFSAHPNVVQPTTTLGGARPGYLAWMQAVIADLEDLGLTGERLVLAFRLLEGFGAGSTVFDLGGAPDHLVLRRERLRALAHPAFDEASRSVADVAALNETAFEVGVAALLDTCEGWVRDAEG